VKERFEEFYEMLRTDRQNSSYSQECTFETRQNELLKEVAELGAAIAKDDVENMREELGDALWDLLFLFILAEEKKLFTAKEVIEDAMAKLKRRKPWIFTKERLTREEEYERWQEAKRKEKLGSADEAQH